MNEITETRAVELVTFYLNRIAKGWDVEDAGVALYDLFEAFPHLRSMAA